MAESSPMNGGDGIYSYAKNSHYQREASNVAKRMIEAVILERLDVQTITSNSKTFCIADLRCTIGPNTFFTVENVIEIIKNKCSSQGLDLKTIEFQVFFNDQITNYFNTLFSLIPSETKYYVSAVLSSFYGQLFPRYAIHFAHSSHAIHWLSWVPEGLLDQNFGAWNEGRIYYAGVPSAVVDVYTVQFEKDFAMFLSARAKEIVVGEMMALILPGILGPGRHSDNPGGLFNFFESILVGMANEVIVFSNNFIV